MLHNSKKSVASLLLLSAMNLSHAQQTILNEQCPPSFAITPNNQCELVSLYDFYDSPESHGGFRVELPKLKNTYSPQQIDLGRILFFDPVLSKKQDMSCASCHQLEKSLADGRGRSISASDSTGKHGQLNRGTPTLWNIAFHGRFMWDGRSEDLAKQARLPLFSEIEMGNTPSNLEKTLNNIPEYVDLFQQAFQQLPNVENTTQALAAFETSLISLNSRYDRYVHGDETALSTQEIRGYNAFRGFVGRCSQCHMPPLFTDGELSVIGSPQDENIPIDKGAGEYSDDPFLMGAFRVPTLRNITQTAPYFHAGQFDSLEKVLDFYNDTRGHMAPPVLSLKLHWHIHMTAGGKLTKQDEQDIVAFLSTLEDETLLPQKPNQNPSGIPIH